MLMLTGRKTLVFTFENGNEIAHFLADDVDAKELLNALFERWSKMNDDNIVSLTDLGIDLVVDFYSVCSIRQETRYA